MRQGTETYWVVIDGSQISKSLLKEHKWLDGRETDRQGFHTSCASSTNRSQTNLRALKYRREGSQTAGICEG